MRERGDMSISFHERESLRRGQSRSQQGRWANEPKVVNDHSQRPLCLFDETCSIRNCIHLRQKSSLLRIGNVRERLARRPFTHRSISHFLGCMDGWRDDGQYCQNLAGAESSEVRRRTTMSFK